MSSARTDQSIPDLTITCCVEFGRLEEQTVLMVRSLRTFGGAFANIPVLAIIGRRGPSLRQATLEEFDRLGVRVVFAEPSENPATWLNYANKVAAVSAADRLAETGQVAWFDSDMFVLKEPKEILLRKGEDLAAQCHHLPPAVIENDPTHVSYWTKICALFDVSFDDIPWTRAADRFPRQKLNFTSGLFTWRRGSGFATAYANAVRRVLDARIAQATGEFFTVDQVVFTPLILREKLRWKCLTEADHSIVLGPFLAANSPEIPDISQARILHYSNSFAPQFGSMMDERLEREVPDFFHWLRGQRLMLGQYSRTSKIYGRMLKVARGIGYRLYERSTERAVNQSGQKLQARGPAT